MKIVPKNLFRLLGHGVAASLIKPGAKKKNGLNFHKMKYCKKKIV